MPILQTDISGKEEELINAIHDKHKNCQLGNKGVEKNVIRIVQSYKHTLWGEIFGSFEPIRHIMYTPAFEETDITEEMRDAFWNKDWWLITERMLTNSWASTFIGLRKIIEKRDKEGNISNISKGTSSITVITQKFQNLLSPHTEKDESIEPFLKNLEDTTEKLIQMRTKIIDPNADTFFAHMQTNRFDKFGENMPRVIEIQDCIDLCESYYQIIYSFYLNTSYGLHGLKQQIANALYPFLDALRVSEEYDNNREEITAIIINEKSISKRNEEIAKKLMKIIEPRLYEIMCRREMRQKIEELTKGLTVYISETGDRYHKSPDCPRLQAVRGQRREPKEVSLLSVKECMYHPCPTCRPDEG